AAPQQDVVVECDDVLELVDERRRHGTLHTGSRVHAAQRRVGIGDYRVEDFGLVRVRILPGRGEQVAPVEVSRDVASHAGARDQGGQLAGQEDDDATVD